MAVGVLGFPSAVSAQDRPLDLDGEWTTEQHEEVLVKQSGDRVEAMFTDGGGCTNGGARQYFISGELVGDVLRGTMMRCTRDPHLVNECGLTSVYSAPFEANVSRDHISGTWRSEYYARGGDCGYTRDPSQDFDVLFELSRTPRQDDRPGAMAERSPDASSERFVGRRAGPADGGPVAEPGDMPEAPESKRDPSLGCWVGRLSGESRHSIPVEGHVLEHRFSVHYRLREELRSDGAGIRHLGLVHDGSLLRDEAVNRGYDYLCRSNGEIRLTGSQGAIFLNDGRQEVLIAGCRVPPGGGIYALGFWSQGEGMPQRCNSISRPSDLSYSGWDIVDYQLPTDSCKAVSFSGDRNRMAGRNEYREVSLQWDLTRSDGDCLPGEADDLQ